MVRTRSYSPRAGDQDTHSRPSRRRASSSSCRIRWCASRGEATTTGAVVRAAWARKVSAPVGRSESSSTAGTRASATAARLVVIGAHTTTSLRTSVFHTGPSSVSSRSEAKDQCHNGVCASRSRRSRGSGPAAFAESRRHRHGGAPVRTGRTGARRARADVAADPTAPRLMVRSCQVAGQLPPPASVGQGARTTSAAPYAGPSSPCDPPPGEAMTTTDATSSRTTRTCSLDPSTTTTSGTFWATQAAQVEGSASDRRTHGTAQWAGAAWGPTRTQEEPRAVATARARSRLSGREDWR
jgi:hypothetical protein